MPDITLTEEQTIALIIGLSSIEGYLWGHDNSKKTDEITEVVTVVRDVLLNKLTNHKENTDEPGNKPDITSNRQPITTTEKSKPPKQTRKQKHNRTTTV